RSTSHTTSPRSVQLGRYVSACVLESAECRSASDDRERDAEEGKEERPDEPQVLVVVDLCDGESADQHHGGWRHQESEAVAHDPGGDGGRAVDSGKVGERSEQRHSQGGVARAGGDEERQRDVDQLNGGCEDCGG